MADSLDYVIRPVREDELPEVTSLLHQVPGWDCYKDSFVASLYQLDPEGCLAAVSPTGKLLSVCLSYRLNGENGRIARFVTDTAHRRKGIGHQLFTKVLQYLEPRNVSLDALTGHEARYEAYGFNISSFQLTMLKCKPKYDAISGTPDVPGVNIVERDQVDFGKLVEYDSKIHTCERRRFLETWLPSERARIFVAVDAGGTIVGYVGFWTTLTGHRLMPMFAESADIARMLWRAGIRHIPRDSQVEAAIVTENESAMELAKTFLAIPEGHQAVGTVRMYTKHSIHLPLHKVFTATDYDFSLI